MNTACRNQPVARKGRKIMRQHALLTFLCHLRTVAMATVCLTAVTTFAQDSSLFRDARGSGLTLERASWMYQAPPEPRPVRLHDIITVLVDEKSVVISEGEIDNRKKASLDAVLNDWILLKNMAMIPDPQSAGEPQIKGKIDKKYRSEEGLETRDSMIFRVAVTVVDIRPNGNLVVEGTRSIQNNEEVWEYSLSGEVRPEDLNKQTNSVRSENVAALRIIKREAGHVRDGYRRGWLQKVMDGYQLF